MGATRAADTRCRLGRLVVCPAAYRRRLRADAIFRNARNTERAFAGSSERLWLAQSGRYRQRDAGVATGVFREDRCTRQGSDRAMEDLLRNWTTQDEPTHPTLA